MKASELIDKVAGLCQETGKDLEIALVLVAQDKFILDFEPEVDTYCYPTDGDKPFTRENMTEFVALCNHQFLSKLKQRPVLELITNEEEPK